MPRRRFDLLIFDFDGTLASSARGIGACLTAALERFGYEAPAEDDLRATIGLTLEESIGRLTNGACAGGELAEVVRTYRELHDATAAPLVVLFDGVQDTLRSLRASGDDLVLVSNKGARALHTLLSQLGIAEHFDTVLGGDQVAAAKPHRLLYDADIWPRYPDIPPARTLVVGDTESDLHFAANIGAHSCWASYGYGDTQACAALRPDHCISTIGELVDICAET